MGLFPVLSSDTEVGSVRDSIYGAAAIWSLYQAYRFVELTIDLSLRKYLWQRIKNILHVVVVGGLTMIGASHMSWVRVQSSVCEESWSAG